MFRFIYLFFFRSERSSLSISPNSELTGSIKAIPDQVVKLTMKNLYNVLRRVSSVVLATKQIASSSSSLPHACILKSHQFPTRSYCSQFQCLWPSNLPPATEWGYGKRGPDTWASKYPEAGGKKQSPIDIVTSQIKSGDYEAPLTWKYEPGICKSIVNTGCGWRVDIEGSSSELSGGPLSNKYELVQFHCHWGDCSNTCGSEHTVDGKSYAGELHFVHWNKEKFASCAEAVSCPEGLTVLGVFLEVGEKNSEIEKLCEVIANIPDKDQKVELESDVDPVAMYPANHSYWTYTGSLTTPPCFESVTWIVFKDPITVSEEQLNCFRQMKKPRCSEEEDPGCVDHNYRPPQSLNDREVYQVL